MKEYKTTNIQGLLLDKGEVYRNTTIDMAVRLNCHLDNQILLQATNEEIRRNDGLKILIKRRMFKWYNQLNDTYEIPEVKKIELKNKTKQEIEEHIDSLCAKPIVLKKVQYPFEIYQLVCDDCDYVLLRVLHLNMDAYAVLLTLTDLLKVYFAIERNYEIPEQLTSVDKYLENYQVNEEKIKARTKEDNKFFLDQCDEMGEPTYLSCGGGYDGKTKRVKYNAIANHPCEYYTGNISKELADLCNTYCKDNEVNFVSLFLAMLEMYYSAKNDNFEDVNLFFTANLRAKLSEKKLPLTTSTAIFFRRLINNNLTFKEFVKECDLYYLQCLKHYGMDITTIMKRLISLDIRHLNGRYDQIVFTLIPISFDSLPEDVEIKPYWPKAKEASDFIIYFVLLTNKDGSFETLYRFFTDIIDKEPIVQLDKGIIKMINEALPNPDRNVKDIMASVLKGE